MLTCQGSRAALSSDNTIRCGIAQWQIDIAHETGTSSDTDKARLLAASSPHTGDWLHAPPIASVGLRLSDEAVRVAVAHRLGSKACEPHTCVCVCVAKQSVHEDSMAWLVAEVLQDISVTASSMISYGGLSREHQFQL